VWKLFIASYLKAFNLYCTKGWLLIGSICLQRLSCEADVLLSESNGTLKFRWHGAQPLRDSQAALGHTSATDRTPSHVKDLLRNATS
jgi:hypothetical protein